ncbi:serine protease [Comamonas testosteroni]|uniref:trypsin-like serine peptidase n=1 Tax=Comamonas testosteroni TaxID=285 RepID=UPI0023AB25B9|nr:serine protease [Comamonas testosteroni]WEE76662.1 serine protease [Comamonas testosteroni]
MTQKHQALITEVNDDLWKLERSWRTAVFTPDDGIDSMDSLHQAGDSLVAVIRSTEEGLEPIGSGVMIGPGLLLTATHVLEEVAATGYPPLFMTFLPNRARAWLAHSSVTSSGLSEFDSSRKKKSDITLVSCTLNSDAHTDCQLTLAPLQVALPLVGDRLWAFGYRHHDFEAKASRVTPLVSSGLVTAVFPDGRGERMPAACIEVAMDTFGGMSGGPVANDEGYVIGVVSSSFDGGPSYVTLIWDVMRHSINLTAPWLQRGKVTLLSTRDLGLVKLKGNVKRSRRGNVVMTMSDEEMKQFVDAVGPERMRPSNIALDDEQLETFMNDHSHDIDEALTHAAIDYLASVDVNTVSTFLRGNGVPDACLEPISGFQVEDYEGIEDLSVISNTRIEGGNILFTCEFELLTVIWTVSVPTSVYMANATPFDAHFVNAENMADGQTTMEATQRIYFEAELTFDTASDEIEETRITMTGAISK